MLKTLFCWYLCCCTWNTAAGSYPLLQEVEQSGQCLHSNLTSELWRKMGITVEMHTQQQDSSTSSGLFTRTQNSPWQGERVHWIGSITATLWSNRKLPEACFVTDDLELLINPEAADKFDFLFIYLFLNCSEEHNNMRIPRIWLEHSHRGNRTYDMIC